MKTLDVITSNKGKYREYEEKLSSTFVVKMNNVHYPEIQASRLEDVVHHAFEYLEDYVPLMIDDSGLFINRLKGFPGVYSAYVMKTLGCEGILKLMEGEEDRKARFECVIGLFDDEKRLFKGICEGRISTEMRGDMGFGYDPIFIPSGYDFTFAEMETDRKNKISHRGKAMKALLDHLER